MFVPGSETRLYLHNDFAYGAFSRDSLRKLGRQLRNAILPTQSVMWITASAVACRTVICITAGNGTKGLKLLLQLHGELAATTLGHKNLGHADIPASLMREVIQGGSGTSLVS